MAEGITQLAEAEEKRGRAGLQQPRCRERRLEKAGGQWAGLHLPFQEQAAARLCCQLCPCSSHSTASPGPRSPWFSYVSTFIHPHPLSCNYLRPMLTLLSAFLSLNLEQGSHRNETQALDSRIQWMTRQSTRQWDEWWAGPETHRRMPAATSLQRHLVSHCGLMAKRCLPGRNELADRTFGWRGSESQNKQAEESGELSS